MFSCLYFFIIIRSSSILNICILKIYDIKLLKPHLVVKEVVRLEGELKQRSFSKEGTSFEKVKELPLIALRTSWTLFVKSALVGKIGQSIRRVILAIMMVRPYSARFPKGFGCPCAVLLDRGAKVSWYPQLSSYTN